MLLNAHDKRTRFSCVASRTRNLVIAIRLRSVISVEIIYCSHTTFDRCD